MVYLEESRYTRNREGTITAFPLAEAAQVWKGGLVAAGEEGLAGPAGKMRGVFLGVSLDDAFRGADHGPQCVRCMMRGVFSFHQDGTVRQEHVGRPLFALDDQTVTVDPDFGTVCCGTLEGFDGKDVWVRIDHHACRWFEPADSGSEDGESRECCGFSGLASRAWSIAEGKGFHEARATLDLQARLVIEAALVMTEVAELIEGARAKDVDWDNVIEECADIVIRVMDMAEGLRRDPDCPVEEPLEAALLAKMARNEARPRLHGKGL